MDQAGLLHGVQPMDARRMFEARAPKQALGAEEEGELVEVAEAGKEMDVEMENKDEEMERADKEKEEEKERGKRKRLLDEMGETGRMLC